MHVPHTRFWFTRYRGRRGIQETINWDDGCNGYGGWMRIRGHTMRVWHVAGTTKACVKVGPNGKAHMVGGGPLLMNFFWGTLHWRLRGPHLAISSDAKTLRLHETKR